MKIEDIKISGKKRYPVKSEEIKSLESSWWLEFPKGYREFMAHFGDGILGSFVRIYTPAKIHREVPNWRERINEHWFWGRGKKLLPKERALECVIIGDTIAGDELIFHPQRPNTLFVLPSEDEQVHSVGADLLAAIEWMCKSGKLVEKFSDLTFEPSDSSKERQSKIKETKKKSDKNEETLDAISKLGQRWIKRRSPGNLAKKDLRDFLKAGEELKLVHEGVGVALNEPAYIAVFKIKDKKTGRLAGILAYHTNGKNGGGDRLM